MMQGGGDAHVEETEHCQNVPRLPDVLGLDKFEGQGYDQHGYDHLHARLRVQQQQKASAMTCQASIRQTGRCCI